MEREGFQPEEGLQNFREAGETLDNGTEVLEFTPEDQKSEVTTVWVGGFGTNTESYRPALEALTQEGRKVVAFTHPREGVKPAAHREMLPEDERGAALPPAVLRRALDLLEVMNAKNEKKVDVVGHSMGGASAVLAALGAPGRFRSMVLIDPIGLVGKHSDFELAGRYVKSQIQSTRESIAQGGKVLQNYQKYFSEGGKEAFKNLPLTIQEVRETSKTDIAPMLKELHDQGIKISIVHATDDAMFPMEKMQEMVKGKDIDGFVSIRGQHEESFVFRPKEAMAATDELLSAMERKTEKEKGT